MSDEQEDEGRERTSVHVDASGQKSCRVWIRCGVIGQRLFLAVLRCASLRLTAGIPLSHVLPATLSHPSNHVADERDSSKQLAGRKS